jgi:hypothetical protein
VESRVWKLRHEDPKFKASLDYTARLCLKTNKRKWINKMYHVYGGKLFSLKKKGILVL